MGWRGIDEELVRRGEPLLSLYFLDGYDYGLMNKVGRPFKIT